MISNIKRDSSGADIQRSHSSEGAAIFCGFRVVPCSESGFCNMAPQFVQNLFSFSFSNPHFVQNMVRLKPPSQMIRSTTGEDTSLMLSRPIGSCGSAIQLFECVATGEPNRPERFRAITVPPANRTNANQNYSNLQTTLTNALNNMAVIFSIFMQIPANRCMNFSLWPDISRGINKPPY